jgi:CHASE2 domain-containing sensor protein/predicted Ser/Thr protein kinase
LISGLWKKDWLIALLLTVLVIVLARGQGLLSKLERVAYDVGVSQTHRSTKATDRIAIVAIDEPSIEQIGRWPWSRGVLAQLLRKLAHARAKAVGLQIILSEPQTDLGLKYIQDLAKYVNKTRYPRAARGEIRTIQRKLRSAENALNVDSQLARALPARHNVFMPMVFNIGNPLGDPDGKLPAFVRENRLTQIKAPADNIVEPLSTNAVLYPLPEFGKALAGVGHINVRPDTDGGVRLEPLVLNYYGDYYPSLSLLLAARSLNVSPRRIRVDLGKGVGIGKLFIRTDELMRMYTGFYTDADGKSPFSTYSFVDVLNGKIPLRVFRNKIVIIGSTAPGVGKTFPTPVSAGMPEPVLTANLVTSILNEDFYSRPTWTAWAELGLLFLVAAYLVVVLPKLRAGMAAMLSLIVLIGLVVLGQYMMLSEKTWLQTISPAFLLVIGHIVLTTKRFLTTERQKAHAESDSAQNNRMLGLTFQSQGQLDMALDKFRSLPVDDSVLELIYNLALDFERKRQFSKAVSCYDHILKHNKKFRDVKEKRDRAQAVDGTIIMGGRAASPGGTLIVDGAAQKPTLGRYQVDRELGRGAMGTVYLGHDPKINRVVAIKTLDLTAEFEDGEIESVKERFFREAETAGRLNHPNIVTIYDAGEEHDLAYIAMEFLEGKDLASVIAEDDYLDSDWVLDVVAQVADALDYAHRLNVVHRDIKPANIMFNEADGTVKVTDFGIARITDRSKTKTGIVLGTPSYMSPEQFTGKKVDGRSDLFSLGATMFELLTGEQPFGGDSIGELMYQITNAKHPNPQKVRDDLPACTRTIIDKALQKDANKRYQTGEQFADAVRRCMNK